MCDGQTYDSQDCASIAASRGKNRWANGTESKFNYCKVSMQLRYW